MRDPLRVPGMFRRGNRKTEELAVLSAVELIGYVCERLELDDLGSTEMLDVGCGTKFTQAFLNFDLPVKGYVGVDVYEEMIEFLRREVDDPRFEYHHMNTKNSRYNPEGEPLTEDSRLPFGDDRKFDVICLFSVFTHLEPRDYHLMLRMLRRYVKPDGRVIFSLFIDEKTPGGLGLMDAFARQLGDEAIGTTTGFRDLKPDRPLELALYSKEHALELIGGTGWEVVRLDEPTEYVQHHFLCRPV